MGVSIMRLSHLLLLALVLKIGNAMVGQDQLGVKVPSVESKSVYRESKCHIQDEEGETELPKNIEMPSKRFLLAPKLSKLYKWKLVQKLQKMGEDIDRNSNMEQIVDTLNVIMKAHNPDI